MINFSESDPFSPYACFTRDEWSGLRASTPLTLSEADLDELRGINEEIALDEVADIYLPLSRLLNLYVAATQNLYCATDTFLGNLPGKVPYVIGVAGSVAAGKSTSSRILQALLARWPNTPKVDLVTTDGFLFPNHILAERGIMQRKGFPESYDLRRLVQFVADVKSGVTEVSAPVYSHLTYDIVPNQMQVVRSPDIMIIEGLNILQTGPSSSDGTPRVFVSDFFDFSIYVDAAEDYLKQWYIERFFKLRQTAFRNKKSYFHRYADLTTREAYATATRIWDTINGLNLKENILPTRDRASLILTKGENHCVQTVKLRKL